MWKGLDHYIVVLPVKAQLPATRYMLAAPGIPGKRPTRSVIPAVSPWSSCGPSRVRVLAGEGAATWLALDRMVWPRFSSRQDRRVTLAEAA